MSRVGGTWPEHSDAEGTGVDTSRYSSNAPDDP